MTESLQAILRELLKVPELTLLRAYEADYIHFRVKWRPDLVDVDRAVDDAWERNRWRHD